MLKYKGIYRVSYEFDKQGKPQEFTFIPCGIKKGSNIYRYDNDKLLLYLPSKRLTNKLLLKHSNIFKLHLEGDYEAVLIFEEKYLETIESDLKIYKKGKNISPKSKSNMKFNFI